MTRSRDEHIAWCRRRALEILAGGDPPGAVASMLIDLRKVEPPPYDDTVFRTLAVDGMLFRTTPDQVRHWIEGFA